MYEIIIHKRAVSFYNRLNEKQQERLNRAIDRLEKDPFYGRNIKRLKGKLKGKYRLKIGPFRVIYLINEAKKLVIIESIGPRGDIY